jgi:uncharacterized membrane protein YgdD (TMEM256/DUF423 family)
MNLNTRIAVSALLLFVGVGAGAFGAHALQGMVGPRPLEVWRTAVLYQLVHGLGLLLLTILSELRPARLLKLAWATMLLGVLLFSGSLYLIVLTGARWLGPITPLGGLVMMLSWLLLAWAALRAGKA